MIGPGTGVRRISGRSGGPSARRTVYLACGVTDMRKGIAGLSALAQDSLRQDPASGAVFAFRGRSGDRLKLLYWDGQGFCLYGKVLERGGFPWPGARDGTARLTSAHLAMLWDGMDGAVPPGARRPRGWGDVCINPLRSRCLVGSVCRDLVILAMSETLPSDPDELRAMIAALTVENARMTVEVERMTATPRAQDLLVQALQARIAKL